MGTESRRPWIVVGVAVAVLLAVVLGLSLGPAASSGSNAPPIIVALGSSEYAHVLCQATGAAPFEIFFPIDSLTGPLKTSEFSITLLNVFNASISPNGSAPLPDPNLPCAAPSPSGWYVFLSHGTAGAIATFPTAALDGGPPIWSNATLAPQSVAVGDEFVFVTSADPSGTGDHIIASGVGSTNVELAGDTTFPPYHYP
ncbi:MAG: hypothetical protein ACREDE_01120 [Thermoplasmata archaeon]